MILHYSKPLWTLPLSVINDIILLVLLPVLAVVPFMITVYVCIAWTHHPELSLADILRDTFREIAAVYVTPPGRMKKVSGGKKTQTGRQKNRNRRNEQSLD